MSLPDGIALALTWEAQATDALALRAEDGVSDARATAAGLEDADVVHIASHATVEEGLVSQSILRLARTGTPEPIGLAAVGALDLQARLVFLSCCETGLRQESGSGVTGLADAFLGAGADAVVTSSVKVDDEAGLAFARRFYGHWLAGQSAADAARAAQIDLSGPDSRWRHPFYWAFYKVLR